MGGCWATAGYPQYASLGDGRSAGMLGMVQATEAIKCILGTGNLLTDRLLVYDAMKMSFREAGIAKDKDCVVCGCI